MAFLLHYFRNISTLLNHASLPRGFGNCQCCFWRVEGQERNLQVVWLQSQQAGQTHEGQKTVTRSRHLGGPRGFKRAQKDQNRKSNLLGTGHQ
jgi:hypothetical protein